MPDGHRCLHLLRPLSISGQHLNSECRKSEKLRVCKEFQRPKGWGTIWGISYSTLKCNILIYKMLSIVNGGEGGIRTRVGVTNPLTAFEAAPL